MEPVNPLAPVGSGLAAVGSAVAPVVSRLVLGGTGLVAVVSSVGTRGQSGRRSVVR